MLTLIPAKSFCQRLKGLYGRDGLADHTGLWIMPCWAVHTLGLAYSIDLLYLNRYGKIIKRVDQLVPNRCSVCWSADSVVELPAGYCNRYPDYAAKLQRALRQVTMA